MSSNIKLVAKGTLSQLADFITGIKEEHYVNTSDLLLGSSIGQHVRHIVEFYTCFKDGYEKRIVNYDLRKRDLSIEQDKSVALTILRDTLAWIDSIEPMALSLQGTYGEEEKSFEVTSHVERELIYNIEHTIHHMAIIKIGAVNLFGYVLPAEFGVASSTIKYRVEHVYR